MTLHTGIKQAPATITRCCAIHFSRSYKGRACTDTAFWHFQDGQAMFSRWLHRIRALSLHPFWPVEVYSNTSKHVGSLSYNMTDCFARIYARAPGNHIKVVSWIWKHVTRGTFQNDDSQRNWVRLCGVLKMQLLKVLTLLLCHTVYSAHMLDNFYKILPPPSRTFVWLSKAGTYQLRKC